MSDDQGAWTAEDDAGYRHATLPEWHPSLFVGVFRAGLEVSYDPVLIAGTFVTPESAAQWGDFSRARRVFESGLKVSMDPLYGIDGPDVAYVRLVETDEHVAVDGAQAPAPAHVTLVWRPEIAVLPGSSWRVHRIGEPAPFTHLPRTAIGVDPRTT